ncbi:MAG TPA: hypothetical protein VMW28_05630 [Pelolinea sp.]|nr:hypothetical protein [Pelolinea sp.]
MKEESTPAESDREAGAATGTPALMNPAEVPSRAVRVNAKSY